MALSGVTEESEAIAEAPKGINGPSVPFSEVVICHSDGWTVKVLEGFRKAYTASPIRDNAGKVATLPAGCVPQEQRKSVPSPLTL